MAQPDSTHDVAVKTAARQTSGETKETKPAPAVQKTAGEHEVDQEGKQKQIQPDGR